MATRWCLWPFGWPSTAGCLLSALACRHHQVLACHICCCLAFAGKPPLDDVKLWTSNGNGPCLDDVLISCLAAPERITHCRSDWHFLRAVFRECPGVWSHQPLGWRLVWRHSCRQCRAVSGRSVGFAGMARHITHDTATGVKWAFRLHSHTPALLSCCFVRA